ncbi:MAG TPA: hypothetical protein VJL27_03065 [Patescibacteria group bacterium]|nr:hypothetical protein [Patescibacteria group bacterium]
MLPVLLAQGADSLSQSAEDLAQAEEDLANASIAISAGSTAFLGGLLIFWIIAVIIGLVFFIWWIVLLIDLTKRDFPQKQTYMIIMILGFFLGFVWLVDLIYYFGIVKKGVGTKATAAPAKPAA